MPGVGVQVGEEPVLDAPQGPVRSWGGEEKKTSLLPREGAGGDRKDLPCSLATIKVAVS